MFTIQNGQPSDLPKIRNIAQIVWPHTYKDIISQIQLDYMLELFYSDEALVEQMKMGHQFILVKKNQIDLGFASFEHLYLRKKITRIHKIYLLPESHGKGVGRFLIDEILKRASSNQSDLVTLNVNRYNEAVFFYQKMGFEIIEEENIELGNGYLMEDFKMVKPMKYLWNL